MRDTSCQILRLMCFRSTGYLRGSTWRFLFEKQTQKSRNISCVYHLRDGMNCLDPLLANYITTFPHEGLHLTDMPADEASFSDDLMRSSPSMLH